MQALLALLWHNLIEDKDSQGSHDSLQLLSRGASRRSDPVTLLSVALELDASLGPMTILA